VKEGAFMAGFTSQIQPMTQIYDAIVLAGGQGSGIVATQPVKGLIEIEGRPMVAWVVDALHAASAINRIIVVIPPGSARGAWAQDITVIEHKGDLISNCESALAVIDGTRPLMWISADIPALTAEAIDGYAAEVAKRAVELSYPLIREDDINQKFPGSVRTYLRLKEGRMTGGNLFTCTLEVANKVKPLMSGFIDARKDPMATVRMLGPSIATKFALGTLSIADVEKRVYKLFGIVGAGIVTPYVGIGVDVDKPTDLVLMERYFEDLGRG
jgi:GTP:adenosylcobinamide-phosphate guanylyltransferase